MQIPAIFRPSSSSLPPLYTWPRSLKKTLLTFAVLIVIGAYMLLGGGIIAFLAILAERAGN
ncbi:MAG: hypothetical protein KDJ65_03700 [Anaerolineae bacterium]|nr:hypothetical protein [Anaerolineae bacterium]